ncbi:hypothetical protein B0T09DRAFT_337573 [Sordaria sp. MPI-SDFR-AT-0083]|nr:hypothetical protein B0T09DRAFT_337573 [Sordaria sp. MPI-SDFR-AT-0083]
MPTSSTVYLCLFWAARSMASPGCLAKEDRFATAKAHQLLHFNTDTPPGLVDPVRRRSFCGFLGRDTRPTDLLPPFRQVPSSTVYFGTIWLIFRVLCVCSSIVLLRPIKPISSRTREVLILHNFGDRLAIGNFTSTLGAKT